MSTIFDLISKEKLDALLADYKQKLIKIKSSSSSNEYDSEVFDYSFYDFLDYRNNEHIDGEFQQWRFSFFRNFFSLFSDSLDVKDASRRYFDLVIEKESVKTSLIFLDRATDLDDELFDFMYDRCRNYLSKPGVNNNEICVVVEFFVKPKVDQKWSDLENNEISNRIRWMSVDVFFDKYLNCPSIWQDLQMACLDI